MKMFRSLWGSWPEWEGKLDSGQIVFVRIRHGQVWIGEGTTGQEASDGAILVKEGALEYHGVTDIIEALTELREQGYCFVPPVHQQEPTQ